MTVSKEERKKKFAAIIKEIQHGSFLYVALKKYKMSAETFYQIVDSSEENSKLYARATELRAEKMAEETLAICDATADDIIIDPETGREIVNHNAINRDRLRVDTRKWLMSKMFPKKYGDKMEVDAKTKQVIEYKNVSKQFPDKE
jgi:hypothetical protein